MRGPKSGDEYLKRPRIVGLCEWFVRTGSRTKVVGTFAFRWGFTPDPTKGLSAPGPGPASAGPVSVCPLRGQTDENDLGGLGAQPPS
jgi:hypothetical protein